MSSSTIIFWGNPNLLCSVAASELVLQNNFQNLFGWEFSKIVFWNSFRKESLVLGNIEKISSKFSKIRSTKMYLIYKTMNPFVLKAISENIFYNIDLENWTKRRQIYKPRVSWQCLGDAEASLLLFLSLPESNASCIRKMTNSHDSHTSFKCILNHKEQRRVGNVPGTWDCLWRPFAYRWSWWQHTDHCLCLWSSWPLRKCLLQLFDWVGTCQCCLHRLLCETNQVSILSFNLVIFQVIRSFILSSSYSPYTCFLMSSLVSFWCSC